jgi:hypothetical protein
MLPLVSFQPCEQFYEFNIIIIVTLNWFALHFNLKSLTKLVFQVLR